MRNVARLVRVYHLPCTLCKRQPRSLDLLPRIDVQCRSAACCHRQELNILSLTHYAGWNGRRANHAGSRRLFCRSIIPRQRSFHAHGRGRMRRGARVTGTCANVPAQRCVFESFCVQMRRNKMSCCTVRQSMKFRAAASDFVCKPG